MAAPICPSCPPAASAAIITRADTLLAASGLTCFWNSVKMPYAWSIVENNTGVSLGGKRSGKANNTAAWGCDTVWGKQHSTLTFNRRPGKGDSRWGSLSFCVFLGIWKAPCMLKKDQSGPQLSIHLWLNLRAGNESWGTPQPVHIPPWQSVGALLVQPLTSYWSKIVILTKHQLFLGVAPRSQDLMLTTKQRHKWLHTAEETDFV